jgi:hypothetical protein
LSAPTDPTDTADSLPAPAAPRGTSPEAGLREGRTGDVGNFSVIRQDDSAGAELAGGLSDAEEPRVPSGPDPFDLDDAYPHGAEMAGRLDEAATPDR